MYDPDSVHIIGIDCAADPKDIAVASATQDEIAMKIDCVFRGKGGPRSRTDRLLDLAKRIADKIVARTGDLPTLLAVDAPLGWPIVMGQALNSHRAGHPLSEPCAKKFFRRHTDRFVEARTGKTPIEVGANLIARVSHTALRLLELVGKQPKVQLQPEPLTSRAEMRSGVHVIEVYPALSSPFLPRCPTPSTQSGPIAAAVPRRSSWGTLAQKLKTAKSEDEWDDTLQRLKSQLNVQWEPKTDFGKTGPDRDHGLDAVLCAWTAWRFLLGQCVQPDECRELNDAPCQLSREGWIWFDQQTRDAVVSCSSPTEARSD